MEARYEVTLIDPAEPGRTRQEIVPAKAILPNSTGTPPEAIARYLGVYEQDLLGFEYYPARLLPECIPRDDRTFTISPGFGTEDLTVYTVEVTTEHVRAAIRHLSPHPGSFLPDSPDNRERVLRVAETYAIIDVLNESLARESARAFVRGR